jgi:hypothetical protein
VVPVVIMVQPGRAELRFQRVTVIDVLSAAHEIGRKRGPGTGVGQQFQLYVRYASS